MPTYITLMNYTQKGIENIKESPTRLDTAKKAFKGMGGELKEFYLTMGQYDAVVIGDVPDDETSAKLALLIGQGGAVKTETFRAFNEEEYRNIINGLP